MSLIAFYPKNKSEIKSFEVNIKLKINFIPMITKIVDKHDIIFFIIISFVISTQVLTVSAEDELIPQWIRDTALLWGEEKISDTEFITVLQWLVDQNILQIPQTEKIIEDFETPELNFDKISFEVTGIEEFVRYSGVRQELVSSNVDFAQIEDVYNLIEQRDKEWIETSPETLTPFMLELIENDIAEQMREHADIYKKNAGYEVYSEIFVTNLYGANIAQTGKTSDYKQLDEIWWIRAKQDGLYISDVHYDESAGVYSADIGLRINDNYGNFLGVIKAVTNVEEIYKSYD